MENIPQNPATNGLLPREKYEKRREQLGQHPTLEIEKNGQTLYFFGANHSKDPENSQYEKLKKHWVEWLQKTDSHRRLYLIENTKRPLSGNEREAILHHAESGLMTYLAHEAGVSVECPEPREEELRAELLKQFSPKEIALYEFATSADSWSRRLPDHRLDFRSYTAPAEARKYWEGFSYDELSEAFEKVTRAPFDPENVNQYCNPNRDDTLINKVARVSSDVRDKYIAQQIVSYWNDGYSLFLSYGSGHLVIQEPYLRANL